MRTLNIQLIGTTPIILHRISRHQFREQLASQGTLSIGEEALEVMVRDDDGNPAVPVSWIWDSIRIGCSRIAVEQGKQLSFIRFQSALHLPFGVIPLKDTDNHAPKWKPYSSVQHAAPGSKKSIAVVAPVFDDWMLSLTVVADDLYDDEILRRVFLEAGKVGIGLFHPPKKQFGQFRVEIVSSVAT